MQQFRFAFVIILCQFIMTLTACSLAEELPAVDLPEGIAETAESAAQKAAESAKTAVSQAGDFAQTAAVVVTEEGSMVLATISAVSTPDINAIRDRFSSVVPDDQGNFSISISDSDLNRVLALRQLITGPEDFSPLSDVAVAFTSNVIFLTADTALPVRARLEVSFKPEVEDGQLRFVVLAASLEGKEAPQSVLNHAETALNSTLGEAAERLPDGLRLQQITVSEGVLTVTGGRR